MIKLYNQVPQVYSKASRDFQYLSWLIDIVLNSIKHNVDDLSLLPKNTADPRLTELLAITLGFKIKRSYDQKQLAALASIIPSILKNKGTEKAITLAGEALLKASGATGSFSCSFDDNTMEVVLPKGLVDTTLFMDLLPYILPAGMTCRVVRKTEIEHGIVTKLQTTDAIKAEWHHDKTFARLYSTKAKPNFANFAEDSLNVGLLDNNIIPTLAGDSQEEVFEEKLLAPAISIIDDNVLNIQTDDARQDLFIVSVDGKEKAIVDDTQNITEQEEENA